MQRNLSDTYQIIGIIGSGGCGDVYKAYHKNLKKYVVLKKIRTGVRNLMNSRREADVLKNLRHSCIPQVLDFLEINGEVYTVMDFIPGNTFRQYLDAGNVFPEKSVIKWAKQICSTLCYMHGQKPAIIHGDLKPANIMLMPDGNICLIDFNISAILDGSQAWVTGYTNGYAPPEQIEALNFNQRERDYRLWKKSDPRSDIYSLGATLYHLVSGYKPMRDQQGRVRDIRETGARINIVFASIIMKCLEPDPNRRYQTANELLDELTNIHQKDRRYKELAVKQKVAYGVTVGCMLICAGIALTGYLRLGNDKLKSYNALVKQERKYLAENDMDRLDSCYERAIKIMPNNLDAYYERAVAYNQNRQYDDCEEFIRSEILGNHKIADQKDTLNNVYYLLADCYAKQEDYSAACDYYKTAVEIDPNNSSYYRDYAIALAYCGETDRSEEILDSARDQGLDSVEVSYVKGEILFNTGDYQGAKQIFLNSIDDTEDSYTKMRAYIMTCRCIDNLDSSINGKNEKISLLEKASKEIGRENNIEILEELAQTYCDAGDETDNAEYYRKAIGVFEQIEKQDMADYDTEYNMAVLYQNIHDYASAENKLNHILDVYGENYRTYKSLAFLEVAEQSALSADKRNYSKFEQYYRKSKELYQKTDVSNANDVEMDRLDDLYQQAVDSGWL